MDSPGCAGSPQPSPLGESSGDFQLHVMDSPPCVRSGQYSLNFQLHVMDSWSASDNAVLEAMEILSTPCNGFETVRVRVEATETIVFQLHVMDSYW